MRTQSILTLFVLFAASAHAQNVAPPPPPLPPNNFSSSSTNTIVYPSNNQITENLLSELEGLQLTPDQRNRIKQLYLEREEGNAYPYISPANPVTRTLVVNLEPGVPPPVIRLSRGQQTSIVFSDVNGNPWNIKRVTRNTELFSSGETEKNDNEEPTNVLPLEPLTPMAYGNVSILLNGLSTPVIFTLVSGQSDVDVRVDAQIPGRNPDAENTVSISSLPTINGDLAYFMDGTPPKEATRLKVRGLEGSTAWAYKGSLYLRTHGAAQFPAYIEASRSTSGVSVYRYASLHDSVTLMVGGRATTIFIEQGS